MHIRPEHHRRCWTRLVTACLLLTLVFTTGCSGKLPALLDFSSGTKSPQVLQGEAKSLAAKGMDDYKVGKYFTALTSFNKILDQYPFSSEATLAELKAADCNYYQEHYQKALDLYKKFEENHPTNEAVPYVMFQMGMSEYKRIDRIDRDTSGATESIKYFNQLLRAYPDSPYTEEAKLRIEDARAYLANHEYLVAKFYVRTEHYKEAKTRLQYLLAMYPNAAIAANAKTLLAQLDAGKPPQSGIFSWIPKFKMPWF